MRPYNEVYAPDGSLRPAYQAFRARTGYDPLRPAPEMIRALGDAPLGDQLKIFPIPLILDEREYQEVIEPGIRQRVLAFQRFFRDVALGDGEILKPGAPLEGMPLDWLFRDQGLTLAYVREVWEGREKEDIRFIYGPDMIRNGEGEWMIIEDNIGIIGGMSESYHALAKFLAAADVETNTAGGPPGRRNAIRNDLETGIRLFLADAGFEPADPRVLGLMPYDDYAPSLNPFELDSERKTALLKSLGIASWNMGALTEEQRRSALGGAVSAFVNFSSAKWKPKKEFNLELFKRQRIKMFEAPHIKYTSSKGFLPYMDAIVRFYMNETPILRNPPTELLTEPRLPDDPRNWVLKRADEAEGKGVLVLPRMFPPQLAAARRLLEEWMAGTDGGFVVVKQRYLAPSYIPAGAPGDWISFLIDLRPTTYIYGWDKVHVCENLNARAISALGDPRNCVTRGAMVLPVIREKRP